MTKRTLSDAEAWVAVRRMAFEDDAAEFAAMSDAELDEEIRKAGGDPEALAKEGAALAEKLGERRERLKWQTEAALAEQEFAERLTEIRARRVKMSREDLKARIKAAQQDSRFAQPVAALFRKRTIDESTDDELQILLEHIEILQARALAKK